MRFSITAESPNKRFPRLGRLLALALAGLAATTVFVVPPGAASRAPTSVEKATIMDAFNEPNPRPWPARCVLILVSTVDPRYAVVSSPAHPPNACIKANAVGNGYALFKRASKTALHWRNIYNGSYEPPCSVPQPVRRDLFRHTSACQ